MPNQILQAINACTDNISEIFNERDSLLNKLLPEIAEFNLGDVVQAHCQNGILINSLEVVSRSPVWNERERVATVEYGVRKVLKDNSLHSQINKIRDTSGWILYESSDKQRDSEVIIEGA